MPRNRFRDRRALERADTTIGGVDEAAASFPDHTSGIAHGGYSLVEVDSVTLETDGGIDWHAGMMSEEARERRTKRKAAREAAYFDEASEEVSVTDRRERRLSIPSPTDGSFDGT